MTTKQNILQEYIVATILFIIIFAISLDGITRYTIRRDELTTLGHIGALHDDPGPTPISFTIESLAQYSADHAPLFYVLINRWSTVVEFNYFALRLLSVWLGMIAIAGTYWLGKHLVNRCVGLIGALLLGTNVIFYSNVHEMREWTMLLAVVVLSWIMYWRMAHKQQTIRWYEYLSLLALVAIGFYTNYLVFIFWACVGLYHLVALPKNRRWWNISVSISIGGLLFLPWLPVFIRGLSFAQSHIDRDNPRLITTLELFEFIPEVWGNGIAILFLVMLAIGLYASYKDWSKARPIVFFFVTMIGTLILINAAFPFIKRMRYLVFLMPPFVLLVGFGFNYISSRRRLRLIPIGLVLIWMIGGYIYTSSEAFNRYTAKDRILLYPDYPRLMPLIDEHLSKQALFIQAYYDYSAIQESKQDLASINQYYLGDFKIRLVNFPLYIQWQDSGIDATPVEYATGLIPQYTSFWFSYHHTNVTDEILEFIDVIDDNYSLCQTFRFGERSILENYVLTDEFDRHCRVTE